MKVLLDTCVLSGLRHPNHANLLKKTLQIENVYTDRILNITSEVAHIWGELTAQAKLKGVTIHASDGLIAATALANGLHVMTRNVDDFAKNWRLIAQSIGMR